MNRPHLSLTTIVFTFLALSLSTAYTVAQEIGLAPLESKEIAKGYRASALQRRPVVNDRDESIGRIDDFVFGREGGIFVVLAVGDNMGIDGHLVAVPFRVFKFDDLKGKIILPGADRAALQKLPIFLYNNQ
jgi:sporulation protein YlmC with PRC-barrel domain